MKKYIELEEVLATLDEYEPYEWFESEHELWLDIRLGIINAPAVELDLGGNDERMQ